MILEAREIIFISISFLLVALVYSSIGHAGASGYAAVLALWNLSPEVLRPTALILNVIVGSVGFVRFYRAGMIDIKKVFPFLIGSMPLAFLSAKLTVDKRIFYILFGFILLLTAIKFIFSDYSLPTKSIKIKMTPKLAIFFGGIIGLLSGITGTGGAIFFTPLILSAGMATPREASGLSVVFVLANSVVSLAGLWGSTGTLSISQLLVWGGFVLVGAFVGNHLGITKFSDSHLKKILGLVLVVASIKLLTVSFIQR